MAKNKERLMLIDKIYKEYKKSVNMSFKQLKDWKNNKISKLASLNRAPINNNLRLLRTPKRKWDIRHVRQALKTIGFIKRMKKVNKGVIVANNYSKRDIALKNWGFDIKK